MKKSENRVSFIFGAIPHSVLRRHKQIKNPTCKNLLLLLAERTFAFRKGFVDLTYRKIADEINVSWRTVATAAKRLQERGDLIRQKLPGGAYRWWLPINRNEVIADPEKRFCVREAQESTTLPHDRSIIPPHDQMIIPPMIDRSWEHLASEEALNQDFMGTQSASERQKTDPLKKVFKETDLKKQQQDELTRTRVPQNKPEQTAKPPAKGDEALYKTLIRRMRDLGVSQRKARQLCREQDHQLIKKVLTTAPKRNGIKNLAAYVVTEIQDGGYENHLGLQNGQKKDPPGSPSRSYAHLTNDNINRERHSNVKPETDALIGYRSVEETRAEAQLLAEEQNTRETSYQLRGRELAKRFQSLSEDLKSRLKLAASAYLEKSLPETSRREEMLKEPAFRRSANRTVLEHFFEWTDQGLRVEQVFEKIAVC